MKLNQVVCDQCQKPIDPQNGKISFEPLRGGLTLRVDNGQGSAGKLINQQVDLCDETCLAEYVKAIRAEIKPRAKATPATPSPAAPAQ